MLSFGENHESRGGTLPAALHHQVVGRAGLFEDDDFANELALAEAGEKIIGDEAIRGGEQAVAEAGARIDFKARLPQTRNARLNRGDWHLELRGKIPGRKMNMRRSQRSDQLRIE
jgi:hypothetical protein